MRSVLGKVWNNPNAISDTSLLDSFSPSVAQLLHNRNITTQEDADVFFQPEYEPCIYDPFLLKGMEQAVQIIDNALKENLRILIYGDYDADGICASTILKKVFERLGCTQVDVYIPHRQDEGYGLHIEPLQRAYHNGVDVIITVDCGSTNFEEAEYCKQHNMQLIITDHHTVFDNIPCADVLVNPHQKGDTYPFKDISGTTVAFKLASALLEYKRQRGDENTPPPGWEKWFLDLVAIATITDVMPVVDENRVLVKYGLQVLAKTRRVGLRALMGVCNVSSSVLSSFTLGFLLGPRLNAAGRMRHAKIAFNLLNTTSAYEAKMLAQKIEILNRERKKIVEDILKEIHEDDTSHEAIVIGSDKWPIGVLGIVAGRLSDMYGKPAFIYQKQHHKIVGSARTPLHFNTIHILEQCSDVLQKFGGHAQAGGFTVDPSYEEQFQQKIINATQQSTPKDISPHLQIDSEISDMQELTEIRTTLYQLQPFGPGNPDPLFILRNVSLSGMEVMGRNKQHLKMTAIDKKGASYEVLGFWFGDKVQNRPYEQVDLVCCVSMSSARTPTPSLELIDMKIYE